MLLYFTSQQRVSQEWIEQHLPGRFDKPPVKRECVGVEGRSGLVFCRDDRFCRFDKNSQTWQPIFSADGEPSEEPATAPAGGSQPQIWIGWDSANPPTPQSLARPKQLPGHFVELAGHQWMIPMAREWSIEGGQILHNVALPRAAKFQAGNWVAGNVISQYQRLYDHATEIFDWYVNSTAEKGEDEENQKLSLPKNSLDICAEYLAANYYVGPEEIGALGLFQFDFESVWQMLRLIIDEPTLSELAQKKTESAV